MQEIKTNPSLLIMEGKTLKSQIISSIKTEVEKVLHSGIFTPPKLVIVFIGDDSSSLVYIKQKILSGEAIGICVDLVHFNSQITQEKILEKLAELNEDKSIHGIILQLPVPNHIHAPTLIEAITPQKDVDGFHPFNIGRLAMGEKPYFISATPLGTLKLLQFYNIPIQGKNIVILNRSNIVGKPLASLLGSKSSYGNATVTLCHTYTKDIQSYIKNADIIISATSIPRFITGDMIKNNAILVDLGQFVEEKNNKRYIIGDINSESVKNTAKAITPVPGGIGPMTVAILMENVFKAFVVQNNLEHKIKYDFF